MNAETLHDALGHLPTDLLLPVEQLRSAPRKRKIPWLRIGALAACLALAVWGGGKLIPLADKTMEDESIFYKTDSAESNQLPAEGAPLEENKPETGMEQPAGQEFAIARPDSTEGIDEPAEPTSQGHWNVSGGAGCNPVPGHKEGVEYPLIQVLRTREELESWYGAYRDSYDLAAFEAGDTVLDARWFQTYDLLVVLLDETTDGICHHPTDLTRMEAGQWELSFQTVTHELENSPWLYFITLEKNLIAEADTITLILE